MVKRKNSQKASPPPAAAPVAPPAQSPPAAPAPPPLPEPLVSAPLAPPLPFLRPGPEGGQRLGGYLIRSALPPGEYGFSFRAEETEGGRRPVILKVAPAFGRGRQLLERFHAELEAAQGADHLHSPGEVSLVVADGLEWLLIPSRPAPASLRSWLQATSDDPAARRKKGLALFRQACLGLASLHWRGRPHLDLKPENLLLFPDAAANGCEHRLRIADFYQGRLLRPLGRLDPLAAWSPSASPYYRAPELLHAARAKGASPGADLYSLGAILFEILDGDPPFEGTAESLEWLHLNMEPPEVAGEAPEYLKALAARCLEKRPAKRPSGVAELGLLLSKDPQEELAFREAEGEGSVQAWRSFLDLFPEGQHAAEAGGALSAAEAREAEAAKAPPPAAVAQGPSGPSAATAAASSPPLSEDPSGLPRHREAKDGLDYIWVAPGQFGMGGSMGDPKASGNEKPRHRVELKRGYWLCATPVTAAAYRRFCDATGRRMPPAPSHDLEWAAGEHPITSVTWEEALAYCEWVEGRLPTEAEWEMAARGGTLTKYWWGEEVDPDCVWFVENASGRSHPVGQKRPNPWGFHEMLGQVWEWCLDWYGQEYYKDSPPADPQGPHTGVFRTLRGGSFKNFAWNIRVSIRNRNLPTFRADNHGFRPVLLKPAPEGG